MLIDKKKKPKTSHKQMIIQKEWTCKVASDQAAYVALLGLQTLCQRDLFKIMKAL